MSKEAQFYRGNPETIRARLRDKADYIKLLEDINRDLTQLLTAQREELAALGRVVASCRTSVVEMTAKLAEFEELCKKQDAALGDMKSQRAYWLKRWCDDVQALQREKLQREKA